MRKFFVTAFALVLALSGSAQERLQVVQNAPMFLLPDAKRQPLTTLTRGTFVDVLRAEGMWLNIAFDDPRAGRRIGYIEARYTNRSTASAARPASQAASAASRQPNPPTPTQTGSAQSAASVTSSTSSTGTPATAASTVSQQLPASPPVAGGVGQLSPPAGSSGDLARRVIYDYTSLYDAVNPSIVKVHADSVHGSGFLVRENGMFATNHHVVRNARYVAVEYSDGRKVAADVVVLDAQNDVAILKVNRQTIRGITPIRLLPVDQDSSVRAGMPVVAFGSPMSQTFMMTQGIVSKVEARVLLGDFVIQGGNSGGPLVSLTGDVVGINTFGEGRTSGAVRVNVLRQILERPNVANYSGDEPDASELPVADRDRYPTEVLKRRIVESPLDMSAYMLDGGRFTVTAITPVLIGKVQVQDDMQQAANRYRRRGKKIPDEQYDPADQPFYEWHRNAGSFLDSLVIFEVKPDIGQTTGSMWMSVLTAVGAGTGGTPVQPVRQTFEFKAEFQELRLYRDGELVRPVTPGRQITERSLNSELYAFVDEAYSGMYEYHPSVFMTGKSYKLDIYDARDPGRVHRSITLAESSKLVQQIRHDFEGTLSQ